MEDGEKIIVVFVGNVCDFVFVNCYGVEVSSSSAVWLDLNVVYVGELEEMVNYVSVYDNEILFDCIMLRVVVFVFLE